MNSEKHIVRPLFDSSDLGGSYTWTYLITDNDTNEAVIIDPVFECFNRDLQVIKEMGIKLKYIVETHVHADHITAASKIRDELGAKIIYSKRARVSITDMLVDDGDTIKFGHCELSVISTPGHTDGCTSYAIYGAVFTGDALLIGGCGRTDFQQGDAKTLFNSVRGKLFTLPGDTIIYPGHDYNGRLYSTIEEEKKYNKRLKMTNSEQDYLDIMDKDMSGLSYPKKIDIAVPENLKAGKDYNPRP